MSNYELDDIFSMNSNQPATTYNSGDDTSSLALSYGNHPPADEMFAQDTLDAHWNPNRSSQFETDFVMPAMALLPQSNVVSAFFIDSKGEILPVEQQTEPHSDQRPVMFGDGRLSFIGFLARDGLTLPFFAEDHDSLGVSLFQAQVCLAGLVYKPPLEWKNPVYCNVVEIENFRYGLATRSTQQVYISADGNFITGVRVYTLPSDDTQFQPWVLGRPVLRPSSSSHPPDIHSLDIFLSGNQARSSDRHPSYIRPSDLDTSSPVPVSSPLGLMPPILGTMAPPTAGTSSSLKRQRVPSIVEVSPGQSSTKKKKLSMAGLKPFPLLVDRVNVAKGQFRVLSLIRQPYPVGPQKLSLADEAHTWARTQETVAVNYENAPSKADLLKLITTEYSTFRSNSINRAKVIVKQEFPNEGPNAISVASIADLLCRLCMSEDCKEVDLDDAVDNLFALRVKLDPNSITESEDDMEVDRPFAHGMILRLLTLLFDQRIRLSSTTVKEKLRPEFVDKSLTTVVGVYAISLLVDGVVNAFLPELVAMPTEAIQGFLGTLSPMVLDEEAEGIKFTFLLDLWEKLERSEVYGPKMELTKKIWTDAIYS